MKNKHRTIGNIFLITGSVLIGGAVILIVTNMALSNNLKKETGMIVGDIKAEISQRTADDPVNDTDGSRSPALYDSELEVAVIDDCPYDGYLTVPAIGLEMAVFDTWNDDYLRKSACRYYGSPYTDDLVIAGHNYKSGFGKLKKLSPGDEVFFTDMNGRVTRYIVEVIEVLDGTAVEEMITGDWDLSLYTCTYGGKSRLTVRCRKASPTGDYNPDWAIVFGDKIYFVFETKGTTDADKLPPEQKNKIECAKKHFAALGNEVRYDFGETFEDFLNKISRHKS